MGRWRQRRRSRTTHTQPHAHASPRAKRQRRAQLKCLRQTRVFQHLVSGVSIYRISRNDDIPLARVLRQSSWDPLPDLTKSYPASRILRPVPDRDCRPSGNDDLSFKLDLRADSGFAHKIRDEVHRIFDKLLECICLDVETGNIRVNHLVAALGFIEAHGNDETHVSLHFVNGNAVFPSIRKRARIDIDLANIKT
jgi:hypothetical protein